MCLKKHDVIPVILGLALVLSACRSGREQQVKGLPTAAERVAREQTLDQHYADFKQAHRKRVEDAVSGFVLIPHGVKLHSSEQAALAAGPTFPEARAVGDFPAAFDVSPYRVVEDRGEVVRVAFLSASELVFHCVSQPVHSLTSRIALEAWVHKASLLPVLGETVLENFEDKSAYAVLPGAPAWPARQTPEVSHVLDTLGLEITVRRGAEPRFLLSYTSPVEPAEIKNDELNLPRDAVLWINREPVLRASEFGPLLRRIRQQRRHDSQTVMVALGDACLQVAALVPRSDVTRAVPEQLPAVMVLGIGKGAIVSRPATEVQHTLFWPDGRQAGVLRQRANNLPGKLNREVSERTGMRCVDVPLHLSEPLCVQEVER